MHNLAFLHKKTWSEYIGNEYFLYTFVLKWPLLISITEEPIDFNLKNLKDLKTLIGHNQPLFELENR